MLLRLRTLSRARRLLALIAIALPAAIVATVVLMGGSSAAAASGAADTTVAPDQLTAENVVAPGESGNTTLSAFTSVTAGITSSYGPNIDNQESLYANWEYKPMQFEGEGQGTAPPGDPNVLIWRDPVYGVPTITGKTDNDAFYGIGYAMAQDRLFQMEVFRHVGQGTLASLIGASGIPMDEQVRRYDEPAPQLMAEFNAAPVSEQQRAEAFVDGINAYIKQLNPLTMPAEFTLLGDLPIKPWTIEDLLGFGAYAGSFFGQFGDGELNDEETYVDLVARYGIKKAEVLFNDLYPLNDPHAPTSIPASEGTFPKQVGRAVKTSFKGSVWANHAPQYLAPQSEVSQLAAHVDGRWSLITKLIEKLGLPRFGSNAVIESGKRTTTHEPMLYGGPQTGWSVPGYFWEAEVHSPDRNERGVFVPALPVMVIGRNESAAWTVTSALDANEDMFELQLNDSNTSFVHDGKTEPVTETTETIPCTTPPSDATSLTGGSLPTLCPSRPTTITLYNTMYGPAVANPDAQHQLFVEDSTVTGNLLSSLQAWDQAGEQTTASAFSAQISHMALGFNFFYIDDHNTIAYWHAGKYPIEAKNADPRLPLPGTGAYDWRGLQSWARQPHVINPKQGWIANWNNKPAVGWYSKNLQALEGGIWGDQWEVIPLQHFASVGAPFTLTSFARVPEDVAYLDNPARVFLPMLRKALLHTTNPELAAIRPYLVAWNAERNIVGANGDYGTPAIVFFDRFFEALLRNVTSPVLGDDWYENAGLSCATCTYVSTDNLSAPTYKYETPVEELVAEAFAGHTKYPWVTNKKQALLAAATAAASELQQSQGSNVALWNEPMESTTFTAQGAISVPAITPFENRGSYGQVVEANPGG